MPRIDLPLDQLRDFRAPDDTPPDFDAFWTETLGTARAVQRTMTATEIDTPFTGIRVFDVSYPGFAGDPIAGWLLVPKDAAEAPAVVVNLGYGGGRGLPHEWLAWPAAGFVTLVADTRGQGSVWGSGGVTADAHGSGPAAPGFMTRGIESRETYYYRRVLTDAVRAVDALREHPSVDPTRIVVAGGSQGGGIALAVAALAGPVAACLPDVPFLCHFRRAVGMTGADPYEEIARYLRVHRDRTEEVFGVLAYFDAVSFAARATAPALFSVALEDEICPPSTVFAAYNAYGGEKDIVVYPFNHHEGGGTAHWTRQVAFLRELGIAPTR